MRRVNYGAFQKVRWSRSSRTDKGVHSLATVISLKINCDKEHWVRDSEGIEYAAAINRCAAIDCSGSAPDSRLLRCALA
jgi:tRNA pseudouridine38-40 synthase